MKKINFNRIFTTVKNLSGHTIGQYKVHAGVSIPSFNNKDKLGLLFKILG